MTNRWKRFCKGMLVGIIAAAPIIIIGTVAHAQSVSPIWDGLWHGVNVATGSKSTVPKPTPPPNNGQYAALGDSVAAGAGLPADTASDPTGQCGRSAAAYPSLVAAARNLPLTHLACGGATVGDLVTAQHVNGPDIPAQLPAAFQHGTPAMITITAGANDVHWSDFLRKCYAATCGTSTDTTVAHAYNLAMRAKLDYALASIRSRSQGTPPKVYITGYYNPFSARCTTVVPQLTPVEMGWLNGQLAALNGSLQLVSSRYHDFVTFVPVDFTGHDVCSADSWIQGIGDPAPFHPTAAGQQAIAQAILMRL